MSWLLRIFGDPPHSVRRAEWLRRIFALAGIALIALTWRLWIPHQVFPQVPLVRAAGVAPVWCEWAGATAMVLGLLGAIASSDQGRFKNGALLLFAISTLGMALIDQGRLQPWAYQFVLVAFVLALADARTACGLLRILVVTFYFHSAVSKFDYSFLHTLGQQFLTALVGVVGASIESWSSTWRVAAAAIFPAGELFVAVGFCFARTRQIALWGAVLLHVLLLVILGPWGLHHKPGVLVWNLYFICQDVVLFWSVRRGAAESTCTDPVSMSGLAPRFATGVILAAVVLPLFGPSTWFDMWPSWGLYASSAERVTLLVHRSEIERLPATLQAFAVSAEDPNDPWMTLRLDRWSLEAVGAPLYPQNRYQLGVAAAVIARHGLDYRVRVVRSSLAERFSGRRRYDVFSTLPQLLSAGDEYYLNAHPRPASFLGPPDTP